MGDFVETLHFGRIEVKEEEVLSFPEGLLGFPECRRYLLLEDPAHAPFLWLQSLDNTDLSFVLVDPLNVKPDYRAQVPREEVAALELEDPGEARLFVICVVPRDMNNASANLKGPLVVNSKNRLGKQVVLTEEDYPTRYLFMRDKTDRVEAGKDA